MFEVEGGKDAEQLMEDQEVIQRLLRSRDRLLFLMDTCARDS